MQYTPANQTPSRENVWKMFDQIASTYDTVNKAMTGGMDTLWRKQMARYLPKKEDILLLDCATGTADQIISLMQQSPYIAHAIGIDMAEKMLEIGRDKLSKLPFKDQVSLFTASALNIPYANESFDCVTMSFGIRNVTSPATCLQEIYRVLKHQGRVLILESSLPQNAIMKQLNLIYLRNLLPFLGGIISKKKEAYRYLNKTIETFPYGKEFCRLLEIHKFTNIKMHPMLFGSVTIYQADKINAN